MNNFIAHGFYATSNFGGYAIEISDDGSMARYQLEVPEVIATGKWQEIRYASRKGPYIRDWHGNKPKGAPSRTHIRLYLNNFLRVR